MAFHSFPETLAALGTETNERRQTLLINASLLSLNYAHHGSLSRCYIQLIQIRYRLSTLYWVSSYLPSYKIGSEGIVLQRSPIVLVIEI